MKYNQQLSNNPSEIIDFLAVEESQSNLTVEETRQRLAFFVDSIRERLADLPYELRSQAAKEFICQLRRKKPTALNVWWESRKRRYVPTMIYTSHYPMLVRDGCEVRDDSIVKHDARAAATVTSISIKNDAPENDGFSHHEKRAQRVDARFIGSEDEAGNQ